MLKSRDKCPCGSGLDLFQCCLPENPPISRRNEGFSSIKLNAQLVDNIGNSYEMPAGLKVNMGVNKPQQIDQVIVKTMNKILNVITKCAIKSERLNTLSNYLSSLEEVLHSVRYHQRQFLFRLMILTGEHLLIRNVVEGNVTTVLEDRPLRYELEDFYSRVCTVLDVVSKLVSYWICGKEKTYGAFMNYLSNRSKKDTSSQKLYLLFRENETWIKLAKSIRNATQHDGKTGEFVSFRIDQNYLSKPIVKNLDARNVCFTLWRQLLTLIEEVISISFTCTT